LRICQGLLVGSLKNIVDFFGLSPQWSLSVRLNFYV
jgi:hypothetical protein